MVLVYIIVIEEYALILAKLVGGHDLPHSDDTISVTSE